MSKVRSTIARLFGWRENPSSVFWLVVPLASLGVMITFLQAYAMWRLFGDYWFFVIWTVGVVIGGVVLYPMYQTAKRIDVLTKESDN